MKITVNLATRPFIELRPIFLRLRIFMAVLAVVAVFAVLALLAEGTVPSLERLIWAPVIVPFLIFAAVTAPFLICFVPTEFLPSLEAAKAAPPPRSKKTAIVDITLA